MQGHIRRRKLRNGDIRYDAVIAIGSKRPSRTAKTKKEADRLLAEMLTDVHSGTYSKPRNILFKDFSEEWLEKYALPMVKPSTYRAYESVIRNHIAPFLGHYPLPLITPRIVQHLIASLIKSGKTQKTSNNTLLIVKRMFNMALQWGYIRVNPTATIKQFRVERKEMAVLSPYEIRLLFRKAEEPFRTLFMMAVLTGMRRGEILGLQWGDIDWINNRIFVRRGLYWMSKAEIGDNESISRWRFITPKSEKSRRVVTMTPTLKKALEIHKIQSPVSEDDLVFCNNRGRPLDPDNLVKREYDATLVRAGIRKIRFHDLRHTFATLEVAKKSSPKYLQDQLGHASIQTTLDRYGKLYPIDYVKEGLELDKLVFGEKVESKSALIQA